MSTNRRVFQEKDKKGHSDAFALLLSEHQNVSDDAQGLLVPRVEMNREIQAKVAERQELFLNVADGRRTSQRRFVNRSCKAARLCGASAFLFCTVVVCWFEEEERLFEHSCSERYLWTDWECLCD